MKPGICFDNTFHFMSVIEVYTDGGANPNPGPGGWGWIEANEQLMFYNWGGKKKTTNNQMELMGMIDFIESASEGIDYRVYSDSTYVVDGLVKRQSNSKFVRLTEKGVYTGWIKGWKQTNYKGKKNPELWKRLDKAIQSYLESHSFLDIGWVKAHNVSEGNDMADELTWVARGGRPAKYGGMKLDIYD